MTLVALYFKFSVIKYFKIVIWSWLRHSLPNFVFGIKCWGCKDAKKKKGKKEEEERNKKQKRGQRKLSVLWHDLGNPSHL